MTPEQQKRIDEIKSRVNEATPGPWEFEKTMDQNSLGGLTGLILGASPNPDENGVHRNRFMSVGRIWDVSNMPFVACSRDDIPWLIELIESLEAKITELRK